MIHYRYLRLPRRFKTRTTRTSASIVVKRLAPPRWKFEGVLMQHWVAYFNHWDAKPAVPSFGVAARVRVAALISVAIQLGTVRPLAPPLSY